MKSNIQIAAGWVVAWLSWRACWHKCQGLGNKFYMLGLTNAFSCNMHINDIWFMFVAIFHKLDISVNMLRPPAVGK
jgi:hypothetical protein